MKLKRLTLSQIIRGLIFIGIYLYAAKVLTLMPGDEELHLKLIGLPCFFAAAIAWYMQDLDLHPFIRSLILMGMTSTLTFSLLIFPILFAAISPGIETLFEKNGTPFVERFDGAKIAGHIFATIFIWIVAVLFNILQSLFGAFAAGLIATFDPKRYVPAKIRQRILQK